MIRKLARIVQIDAVASIPGADAIECARVGGWTVVVKKGEYKPADRAVYFEIDSFLPEGNASWQFLVDKSSRVFNGMNGHVLRSIKLRGQVSQGLLLGLDALLSIGISPEDCVIGEDLSQVLGICKYEPLVPAELSGVARGMFPSRVSKTDQERVQNLATEINEWLLDDALTWEVTEKLEGSSCTFAWLEGDLHVCSRNIDLMDADGNSLWSAARELNIAEKFSAAFSGRSLALQGEIIGLGIQGNIYGLRAQKFFLFDIYDVDQGRYLSPQERTVIAQQMELQQVPVIDLSFRLPVAGTMDAILKMADGVSALKSDQLREGLVFKSNQWSVSFKAISNKYLLKQSP